MPPPLLLLNHLLLDKLSSRLLLKLPQSRRCPISRISVCQSRYLFSSPSHRAATSSHSRTTPPSSSLQQQLKADYPKSLTALETRKATLGSWTTAVVLGIVGLVLVALSSSPEAVRRPQQDQTPSSLESSFSSSIITENWEAKMTREVQSGRPGTLTSEQEEKLRQFWIAASRVFGIIDDKFIEELNKNNGVAALDTKEKPKKRFGVFSRKHKNDSDADSTTSGDTDRARAPSINDDKYGQTKQFYDTISQQSPESLRKTCWSMVKHDHPDALLLRFLRARRWDVDKALIMLVATMNWRATEAHVDDDVMFNGEEGAVLVAQKKDEEAIKQGSGHDFMEQLRMGKSFFHGMDAAERPICYVRARLHRAGEHSEPSLERATFYQIETARMMLAPPVDTATIFFDMTGFSLANMDYAPVKFMIKCFEANYPESLGVVLVHRAPWVFQGVWKIIKGWLDPVVASKVNFTNDVSDLEKFIPKSRLPKDFGGDEDWEYKYVEPIPGENDRMKDKEMRERLLVEREQVYRRYQDATIEWISAVEKGGATLSSISEIKKRRNEIAAELREGYWKLDPYIRARSFYDRTGVLKEGGIVDYYPKTSQGKPVVASKDEATTTVPVEETRVGVGGGDWVDEKNVVSPKSVESFRTAAEEKAGGEGDVSGLVGGVEKVKVEGINGVGHGRGHVETSEADLD